MNRLNLLLFLMLSCNCIAAQDERFDNLNKKDLRNMLVIAEKQNDSLSFLLLKLKGDYTNISKRKIELDSLLKISSNNLNFLNVLCDSLKKSSISKDYVIQKQNSKLDSLLTNYENIKNNYRVKNDSLIRVINARKNYIDSLNILYKIALDKIYSLNKIVDSIGSEVEKLEDQPLFGNELDTNGVFVIEGKQYSVENSTEGDFENSIEQKPEKVIEKDVMVMKDGVYCKLKNSSIIKFINYPVQGEELKMYSFEGILKNTDYFIIRVSGWEWGEYIYLNRKNGDTVYTSSFLQVSPNGKYYLDGIANCRDGYSSMRVYSLDSNNKLVSASKMYENFGDARWDRMGNIQMRSLECLGSVEYKKIILSN